jgi:flagellar hook-basal body complex protein FliE
MAVTNFDGSGLSINGYYIRPTIAYKASTIFGGDEKLASVLEGGVNLSFADMLKAGLSEVNNLQTAANDLAAQFAAGETDNIHSVMIAEQKADIALQLATAIRSKILDAYQEIMRMQI